MVSIWKEVQNCHFHLFFATTHDTQDSKNYKSRTIQLPHVTRIELTPSSFLRLDLTCCCREYNTVDVRREHATESENVGCWMEAAILSV